MISISVVQNAKIKMQIVFALCPVHFELQQDAQ